LDQEAWSVPSFSILFSFFSHSFLGAKGIKPGVLVKIGILWGAGLKAFSGGQYGTSWGLKQKSEIIDMYKAFLLTLKTQSYGPYDAVASLIGHSNAINLALAQGLTVRAATLLLSQSSSSQSSSSQSKPSHSSKRSSFLIDHEEEEINMDDVFASSSHKKPRI
jgi:hypothetical protein